MPGREPVRRPRPQRPRHAPVPAARPGLPGRRDIYPVPYDYRLPDDSELAPDITVARTADLGAKRITAPPLLVVEVISPSSRWLDPVVKRAKYEAAGVPAYWIADPVAGRMTVLRLEQGSYVERAVVGEDDVALDRPYPVVVHLRGLPTS